MIAVGIKVWRDLTYLQNAVMSAIAIADEIILAFGPKGEFGKPDALEALSLIGNLRKKNPGKITVIKGTWQSETDGMNAIWDEVGDGEYFIRLEENEIFTEKFVAEVNEKLIDLIEANLPMTAQTLHFYQDTDHIIHSTTLDTPNFRGCLVDHRYGFMDSQSLYIPGIWDEGNSKSIEIKGKVMSYKYLKTPKEMEKCSITPYNPDE